MDTTFVVNRVKAKKIIESLAHAKFDVVKVKLDGYLSIVTISVDENGYSELYVENVYNEHGEMVTHDTDLLLVSSYLPQNVIDHFRYQSYRKLIMLEI